MLGNFCRRSTGHKHRAEEKLKCPVPCDKKQNTEIDIPASSGGQVNYIKHQVSFIPTHELFHTTMYQSFKLY